MDFVIERVDDYRNVERVVDRIIEKINPKFNDKMIVKPNFIKFGDPESGVITHPSIVRAVVNRLKDDGVEVIIAEGGFGKASADKCFDNFKLREIARCVNLTAEELVKIKVNGRALKDVEIAKTALNAIDGFVSLPKMKVHCLVKVTLGIKNNMGFLKKPAIYMHFKIHQKLVDLLKVFNPTLTIIDGIVGGAGYEMSTQPVKHGVIVASKNVVIADIVASYLMGFKPEEIKYLKMAIEEHDIDIRGLNLEEYQHLVKNYSTSFLGKALGFFQT